MEGGEREHLEITGGASAGRRATPTPLAAAAVELRGWLDALRRADWRSIDRGLLTLAGLTLLGQLAYPLGWVIAGAMQHGYSVINNYVSDLGAGTARDAWIMNTGFVLCGASYFVLALALARSLPQSRARALAVWWFVAIGITWVAAGFLHEDCWSATNRACWARQQAGTLSWHNYAHDYDSVALGLLFSLSPLVMVFALPSGSLRKACGVCAVVGVAYVADTAVPLISNHGFSVPYRDGLGLIERIDAGLMTGWVLALFAAMLLADLVAKSHDGQIRKEPRRDRFGH